MSAISLWIVEDDPDWRRGLVAYFGDLADIRVTFAAENAARVREKLSEADVGAADVVLMDIMLDGAPEGVRLAEEVSATTGARVIMLTSMEEKALIVGSFQAGAIDYRIKSEFAELPEAVRAAAKRASPISPEAAAQLREEFRRLKEIERELETRKLRDLITPSELELLKLIDQGYSQSEIADRQFVSLRTVKNHVNHILKKLKLGGSKEAAREAKEKGLF